MTEWSEADQIEQQIRNVFHRITADYMSLLIGDMVLINGSLTQTY